MDEKLKEVVTKLHAATYNHFIQGRITFQEFCVVKSTLRDVIYFMDEEDKEE